MVDTSHLQPDQTQKHRNSQQQNMGKRNTLDGISQFTHDSDLLFFHLAFAALTATLRRCSLVMVTKRRLPPI
jgi:hypothetical protein